MTHKTPIAIILLLSFSCNKETTQKQISTTTHQNVTIPQIQLDPDYKSLTAGIIIVAGWMDNHIKPIPATLDDKIRLCTSEAQAISLMNPYWNNAYQIMSKTKSNIALTNKLELRYGVMNLHNALANTWNTNPIPTYTDDCRLTRNTALTECSHTEWFLTALCIGGGLLSPWLGIACTIEVLIAADACRGSANEAYDKCIRL